MGYGPQDWDLLPGTWHPGTDPRVWKHKACGERLEFPDDQHRCAEATLTEQAAADTELALRAQVTDLRATLARIEGSAREDARHAKSQADRASFAWIAEECREALGE